MASPEKLLLRIFTVHGAQFQIVTKMPHSEVVRELDDNEFGNSTIELIALDDSDEHVTFKLQRAAMVGYLLGKMPSPSIVRPVPSTLVK